MKALILKELRERRFSLIAYCVATFGFVWLYISIWPFIHSQSQAYAKLLDSFPKGFSDAFGINANFLSNLEGYLGGEMYTFVWPLLAIMLVVSQAGSTIAEEIEKGTLATLLAQPFSRLKLAVSKYLSGTTALLIFIVFSILSAIPLAVIYRTDFFAKNFLVFSLLALLFGLAVYSFAFMVSSISSERSRVYAVTGGILVLMYMLNIVSGLKENLSWLKYSSVFYYFNASDVLFKGSIDKLALLVFSVTIVVCTLLGHAIFKKRDISV